MSDYSLESKFVKQLDEDVLKFVNGDPESQSAEKFNELALREFELQYITSKPYRGYCKERNLSPETITHWEDIPAVLSSDFKDFILSLPKEKAKQIFLAGGGTIPRHGRQKIFQEKIAIELINAVNIIMTKLFLFPDVDRMKILLMMPSPYMAPLMEMAIGLERVRMKFGTPDSRFLISLLGLDIKTLLRSLRYSEKTQEPLTLIGVTGILINFFDACEKEGIRFSLPEGSRICDVERRRNQFGECKQGEYLRKCREILGIEEDFCINVMWMCESSTNYFDNTLKNHLSGVKKSRHKEIPPWARITLVDTSEFKRLPKGKIGLIRFYDLTNRAISFSVQTANLGFETEEGFDIIGLWNKKIGNIDVDHSVGHPGGKMVTKILLHLMHHRLSKVGKIYSCLEK